MFHLSLLDFTLICKKTCRTSEECRVINTLNCNLWSWHTIIQTYKITVWQINGSIRNFSKMMMRLLADKDPRKWLEQVSCWKATHLASGDTCQSLWTARALHNESSTVLVGEFLTDYLKNYNFHREEILLVCNTVSLLNSQQIEEEDQDK